MITLSELKEYIKYEGEVDNNSFLTSCIQKAVSRMETKCMRSFTYGIHTEFLTYSDRYCNTNARSQFFLNHLPIVSISNIYKMVNEAYEDIFVSPDTVASSTIVNENTGEVSLVGYSFPYGSNGGKVIYYAGYKFAQLGGTVRNDENSNDVIGAGTTFTTDFVVGDNIQIGSETRKITAITDNLNLVVDFNFINVNVAGTTYYINNTPEMLKNFCLELATWIYYGSPQSSEARLGITSKNQGGQSQTGQSYQEPDWTDIIQYTRIINI